ncbi:AraC family transcriptional regulator [Alcanivorax quisquiliarum]|uniref:AraC family transcriptional regulator n=1 Tax=Alcanivorax quisquiliarum TaxID=2933565 RepID=A0ABT0E548_9GAMM|nr:AraC family transcriptional regulator [Alcanivorax quisquiliarum]MCK0536757.1 AraC family transcriptional regulator [Alcanivorax quisquiliarum]
MDEFDRDNGWVSARHLQHIVARGESAGLGMAALLQQAGLHRGQLADSAGSIPVSALEQLLEHASQHYRDPLLGLHLASNIQPATFGVIGHLVQTCDRFSDVLDTLTRYNGLLSNIGTTSVNLAPGQVHVCWQCHVGGPLFQRHAREYVMGAFVTLVRLLLPGQPDVPLAVHFPHERPGGEQLHASYQALFRCAVYFRQDAACVVLPARLLRERLPHGDTSLREMLEQHARTELGQRAAAQAPRTLTADVRHLIQQTLPHQPPSRDSIAAQLGLSGRTLHRRLASEGSSYQALLDDARLERARTLLTTTDTTHADIAVALGFGSAQSFTRWFRRRTGATPSNHRSAEGRPDSASDDNAVPGTGSAAKTP